MSAQGTNPDLFRETRRGALAVAAGATLWGTWKIWLTGPVLDSSTQGGLVLTVSGLIASFVALLSRRRWPGVSRQVWVFLVLFGLAEAINSGLFFLALSYGDTATAAMTHYLAPVLVAVTAPFFSEPVGRRARPAALVAFFATLGLVGFSSSAMGTRAAALAGAGSAIFYAACVFLAKRISGPLRPWEVVGFHNLIAGVVLLLAGRTSVDSAGARELSLVLIGAVIGGMIASGLYMYGIARIPAARAAILAYLEPVSAALIGAVLFREQIQPVQLVAMAIIIAAGVAVATEPADARRRDPEALGEMG